MFPWPKTDSSLDPLTDLVVNVIEYVVPGGIGRLLGWALVALYGARWWRLH
jgi:hypothetical protein